MAYNHLIKPTAKSAIDFKWFDCLVKIICKIHGAFGFFCSGLLIDVILQNIPNNSMKILLYISVFLMVLVSAQSIIELDIGAKLDKNLISSKNKIIQTHPSQFRPFITMKIDCVDYKVAYDKETFEIKYIHTDDQDFLTEDSLSIGSLIQVRRDQIFNYPGWEIQLKILDNGWYPIIGYDLLNIITKNDTTVSKPFSQNLYHNKEYELFKIIGFSKGGN